LSNGASFDDGSTLHYKVLTKSQEMMTPYIFLELLDCRWELCVWLIHGVESETSYSPRPKEKKCSKISGLLSTMRKSRVLQLDLQLNCGVVFIQHMKL